MTKLNISEDYSNKSNLLLPKEKIKWKNINKSKITNKQKKVTSKDNEIKG